MAIFISILIENIQIRRGRALNGADYFYDLGEIWFKIIFLIKPKSFIGVAVTTMQNHPQVGDEACSHTNEKFQVPRTS